MTIACPAPQWPEGLLEEGPPEDPTILLRGEAGIGGAHFTVTAVRVDPIPVRARLRFDGPSRVCALLACRS